MGEEEMEIIESELGGYVPLRFPNFEQTDVKKFWDKLEEEELVTTECEECGHIEFPPKIICTKCYSDEMKWIDLPREGEIYTYSEMHSVGRGFEHLNPPLCFGIVELENGVRLVSHIEDVKFEDLSVGDKVKVDFKEMNWCGYKKHKYFVFRKK